MSGSTVRGRGAFRRPHLALTGERDIVVKVGGISMAAPRGGTLATSLGGVELWRSWTWGGALLGWGVGDVGGRRCVLLV